MSFKNTDKKKYIEIDENKINGILKNKSKVKQKT